MRHNSSRRFSAARVNRNAESSPSYTALVCRARSLFDALHVLQHAPFVLERGVLLRTQTRAFDLLALELPQVQQPQLLLLASLPVLPTRRPPARHCPYRPAARSSRSPYPPEASSIVALRVRRKQKLLIVLSVDIGQEAAQVPSAALPKPACCRRKRAIFRSPESRAR